MSLDAIFSALKVIPSLPGVYRMVNAQRKDLYIGKAKNLFKRVSSYCCLSRLPERLRRMVHNATDVQVLITANELEALLLEANLIKRYQPPYNILLKEGNSFSYLVLTEHEFPRLQRQRSPVSEGFCLGPFLSAGPLEHIMTCLHKAFLLRSCSDFVFNNRSRPCLEYYIKRCSAPCVKKQENYNELVNQAIQFLKGNTTELSRNLERQMKEFSQMQEYDKARIARDRLKALSHIVPCQKYYGLTNADVICTAHSHGTTCVQLMCFRNGSLCGTKSVFFHSTTTHDAADILSAFIRSFYEKDQPPSRILLNHPIDDEDSLKLLFRHFFQKVPHFVYPKKGRHYKVVQQAENLALEAIQRHIKNHQVHADIWEQAKQLLCLKKIPKRIEIYDNSHNQGDCPVSGMVVATPEEFLKKEYRAFFVPGKNNDDYEMMRFVIKRRCDKGPLADLMIIDGGPGQISVVQQTLAQFGFTDTKVISIAKSTPNDVIYVSAKDFLQLDPNHPVLFLIQRLRDEAHRFAVTCHRRKKRSRMTSSVLQQIPGIGPKRYIQLMGYFKTREAVMDASVEEFQKLFSKSFAQKLWNGLHVSSFDHFV